MKKYSMILLIALFFVGGCSNHLPIYELEENFNTAIIDGKEYALHKLSYNGKTYLSEPEQFIKPIIMMNLKLENKSAKQMMECRFIK